MAVLLSRMNMKRVALFVCFAFLVAMAAAGDDGAPEQVDNREFEMFKNNAESVLRALDSGEPLVRAAIPQVTEDMDSYLSDGYEVDPEELPIQTAKDRVTQWGFYLGDHLAESDPRDELLNKLMTALDNTDVDKFRIANRITGGGHEWGRRSAVGAMSRMDSVREVDGAVEHFEHAVEVMRTIEKNKGLVESLKEDLESRSDEPAVAQEISKLNRLTQEMEQQVNLIKQKKNEMSKKLFAHHTNLDRRMKDIDGHLSVVDTRSNRFENGRFSLAPGDAKEIKEQLKDPKLPRAQREKLNAMLEQMRQEIEGNEKKDLSRLFGNAKGTLDEMKMYDAKFSKKAAEENDASARILAEGARLSRQQFSGHYKRVAKKYHTKLGLKSDEYTKTIEFEEPPRLFRGLRQN